MTLTTYQLGDLGVWGSGGTPSTARQDYYNGGIPWLIIDDLNDGEISSARRSITKVGLDNSSAKLVPAGTLLVAMYGSIGKLGVTRISCATNQAIAYCKCNPKSVDTWFLFYLLLHQRKNLLHAGRGGTQQNLSQEFLKDFRVSLPTLPTQRRIAAQLEQADRLRRTRRHALELSDDYLPAIFRKLFGNPVKNDKGWPVVTVEEAGTVQLGRQRAPKYQTGKHRCPYIRVANVYENRIDLSDLLYMDFNPVDFITYKLEPGDILLNEGQSTELVGRPAMWRGEKENCCFQNTLVRFKADRKICEPTYALWLFLYYLRNGEFAKISSKTSSIAHLGAQRFAQMKFPLPPLAEQQHFANLVTRHQRLRAIQQESLRQAEHLFQTLLKRAFGDSGS